jgi:hypothetical protein
MSILHANPEGIPPVSFGQDVKNQPPTDTSSRKKGPSTRSSRHKTPLPQIHEEKILQKKLFEQIPKVHFQNYL